MKSRPSACSLLRSARASRAAIRPLLGSIAALCALAAAPLLAGEPIFGLDGGGTTIRQFDSQNPAGVGAVPITGLAGDTLVGLDFRPATIQLYGVGASGRLYTISLANGGAAATPVGAPVALSGTNFGTDFNPVPDRLRVVSNLDQNLRINPVTGAAIVDGTLAYAPGDPNAAQNPNIVASGYTNNFNGTTTTTLYGIDSNLDILVIQNPPNDGRLNTVGALGANALGTASLDISGLSNVAFFQDGATGFYIVNLATGAATLVPGALPALVGIAALPFTPLYWDVNPAAAGLGGTGVWSPTAGPNFTYDPVGTGPNFVWPNTMMSDAVFAGTPGTVSVPNALQVRNVTFTVSGYTVTGAQLVTLVPGGAFTVTNAGDAADIEVSLVGAGALVKNGPGLLELSGSTVNTYMGGTRVNDGVLFANRTNTNDSTIRGPVVVVGDGIGAPNSAELRLARTFAVQDSSNFTVNPDGLLSVTNGGFEDFQSLTLNNGNASIGPGAGLSLTAATALTMNDGTISGPGTLLLNGDAVASGGAEIGAVVALGGTRTFTVADGAEDTDLLVTGPIIGPTFGLIKEGTGLMLLTGASTYTGPTTINAGSFIVDGSTTSANTFVNANGLLGGSGTVGGNVFNRGIVSPGNSTGTLRVSGNYTQFSEGTLRIELVSPSDFDRLLIGGAATLDGTLQVLNISGFRPKRGDTFRFLTANGGISGDFEEIEQLGFSPLLRFEVEERGNSLFLVAAVGSFASTLEGLSPNQRAVAKSLDRAVLDGEATKIVDYLFNRDLNDIYGDLDRIAPEEFAAIFETSISLATVQSVNLQRRTDDLRSGASGFSASGLAMQGTGPGYSGPISLSTGVAGPSGSEGKESKEMKTVVEDDKRWGAFLTGVGEWVDVDGDGNARGYDITTGGFTLGVDYKVTPNFALGLMAGYAGTGADLTGDGRVFVNGGKLGLYATYFAGGFYVDTAASGGYNSYDTKRSALQGTARGDTEGGEFNALFGTGYDWQIGALKIGPTANVQYTYVAFDDFEEHGSLAPLTIGDEHTESFRTALGFKASYDWRVGGVIVKPELRAAWQHEFADDSYDISASFAESGDNQFTTRGPDIGRDSLLLGAGFAVQISERTATYLYYDAQLGRERYESHSVSGGIRVAF